AAWALWKYGKVKIGKLNIKPSNACKHVDHLKTPYNSISGLDWLTLASLRDSENNIGKYDEIEDRVAGISFPSDLISWFGKIGCRNIINSTSLYVSRNVDELVELNNFYSSNNNVILFVSANVIEGDEGGNNKDHWICLASNVKVNNENIVSQSLLNKTVKFNFFTWGVIRTFGYSPTLNLFVKRFYGGLVFTPIR
ncbi:hypothetical protein HYE59_00310, partial [Aggregatibacter actinomycetemcomitans]|nr:hypothetical protein [Aggregatibacter actinomycetemcomitans]